MTIKTTEVMNTASTSSVVGDVDTMGYTAGLGIKHDTGNGLELRLEALVAEIDDVEATGSNGSSYTTKDILGALTKANEEEPNVMTDEMLKFTILNLIVDGYHIISDAMTNLLYLLAVYPDVQAKAQNEIDSVFKAKENGKFI